jgi:hypothetical protein
MGTNRWLVLQQNRFLLSLVLCLVSACGGGGGSNRSAPIPISESSTALVEQVRWDPASWATNTTAAASATVDGQSVTADQLAEGDVVVLAGTRTTTHFSDSSYSEVDTLSTITSNSVVTGPVDSVDLARRLLVVMGQPVQFLSIDTVNCQSCDADSGLPLVQTGDFVRVSGYSSVSGPIFAARIDKKPESNRVRVIGIPRAVDAPNDRFQINGLVIDFSQSAPAIPADVLSQGRRVEVVGNLQAAPRLLLATSVIEPDLLADYGVGDVVALEGLIDEVETATEFNVGSYKVTASHCAPYPNSSSVVLGANLPIAVFGTLDGSGMILADRCSEFASGAETIDGPVDAADVSARTLTVLGVLVQTSTLATHFVDRSSSSPSITSLDSLQIGDFVQVSGAGTARNPTDGVVAGRIDRIDSQATKLMGVPSSMTSPNILMFGHTIQTTSATTFSLVNCARTPPSLTQEDYFRRTPSFQKIVVDRADDLTFTAIHIDVYPGDKAIFCQDI